MTKPKLDKEERELIESYDRGEWKSVKNLKEEIEKHRGYARQTLKKDKRVNIRISSMVLGELQTRAVEDGMPYQTSISSILHRFVTGKLVENPDQRSQMRNETRTQADSPRHFLWLTWPKQRWQF
jgi:predicted DNA binding CopG/RHH family protein